MASTLQITFLDTGGAFNVGDSIAVNIDTGSGVTPLLESWVDFRSFKGTVTTEDTGTGDLAVIAALNFTEAWNVDHSGYGYAKNLKAEISGAVVTITLDNPAWQFDSVTGNIVDNSKVGIVINNEPVAPAKSIATTIKANTGNPCGEVDVDVAVAGGTPPYSVYTNEGNYLNQASPITTTFVRQAINKTIQVKDSLGTVIGLKSFNLPRKIVGGDITFDIYYLPAGGATVTVNVSYSNTNITPYEYSLDGTIYQSENTFPSVLDGTYTAYVKDAFGCVYPKIFIVDSVSQISEVIFDISEINPIRYAKYRASGEKKNHLNTLSCHELSQIAHKYTHKYPSTSIVPGQIKTNAPYLNVYTIDSDGNKVNISIGKTVENTGLTGYTTATLFSANGQANIYWGFVDVLDPDTDDVIGNNNFGAFVPTWADSDEKFLDVEGIGVVKVNRIYYDDVRQSSVVELNATYTGADVTRKVEGTYNAQPYDVYEFNLIMSTTPSEFNVVIEYGYAFDDLVDSYVSEKIKVIEDNDSYLRIDYWDDENRGKFVYQTGINNHVYIPGKMNYVGEQITEGYDGDVEYYKTNDEIYVTFDLYLFNLPTMIAHQMRLILAHKFLFINGVKFKLAKTPDINGGLNTNFKNIVASIKATGNEFVPGEVENVLAEQDNISAALESIQGKANLLWTKINA